LATWQLEAKNVFLEVPLWQISVDFPPVQATNEAYSLALYYNTNAIVPDSYPIVILAAP